MWAGTVSRNYTLFFNSESFSFTCPVWLTGVTCPLPAPAPALSVLCLAASSPRAALGRGKATGPVWRRLPAPPPWEPRRQSPTVCLEAQGRPRLARPQQTLSEFSANSSFSCLRGPNLSLPLCPQNRSQDEQGEGHPSCPPSSLSPPTASSPGVSSCRAVGLLRGTPPTVDPEVQGRLCWGQDTANQSQPQGRNGAGGAPGRQSSLPRRGGSVGRTCPACALCPARGAPGEELFFATHCFLQGPHGSPPDCSFCEEPLQEPGTEHTPKIYWMPTVCRACAKDGSLSSKQTADLELTVLWSQDGF